MAVIITLSCFALIRVVAYIDGVVIIARTITAEAGEEALSPTTISFWWLLRKKTSISPFSDLFLPSGMGPLCETEKEFWRDFVLSRTKVPSAPFK
ncbi:hypothetical protein Leryth_024395 [Lithospermum erythrorhizon]|nr:hypothetical protein Leryth_024395 [Lithospermum erythrorhizon]